MARNAATIGLIAARESALSAEKKDVNLRSTYNVNRMKKRPDSRPETSVALILIPVILIISSTKPFSSTSLTLKTIQILTTILLLP